MKAQKSNKPSVKKKLSDDDIQRFIERMVRAGRMFIFSFESERSDGYHGLINGPPGALEEMLEQLRDEVNRAKNDARRKKIGN